MYYYNKYKLEKQTQTIGSLCGETKNNRYIRLEIKVALQRRKCCMRKLLRYLSKITNKEVADDFQENHYE